MPALPETVHSLNHNSSGSGELRCEIPIIISNHPDLEGVAASFGVPFRYLPLAKGSGPEGKAAQVGRAPECLEVGPVLIWTSMMKGTPFPTHNTEVWCNFV